MSWWSRIKERRAKKRQELLDSLAKSERKLEKSEEVLNKERAKISEIKEESAEALKKKKELLHKQKLLNSGCKMFNINGEQIIARNKKNAERKYNNLINERNNE